MMRQNLKCLRQLLIGGWVVLWLAGCSIELADSTPTKAAPKVTPPPAAAATPLATGAPTSTPPAWADLKINGSLIYTQGLSGIVRIDLATGKSVTLFKPPRDGWLRDATVSPDRKTLIITYAPPPPAGEVQFGYTDIYSLPMEGGEPTLILKRADAQESFFHPTWSPDGKFLYYAHFIPVDKGNGQRSFKYTIERLTYPAGKPEVLVEDAIWPRLSRDGKKLAYLSFDLKTSNNELFIADPDGKNGKALIKPGTFVAVDAHHFSPDDSTILFSAIGEGKTPMLSLLDMLMGVGVAQAHDVPSDWWTVELASGKLKRLTRIYDIGLYGSYSPDGKHIAFIAASGVYAMKADGNNLTPITNVSAVGTLEWIP